MQKNKKPTTTPTYKNTDPLKMHTHKTKKEKIKNFKMLKRNRNGPGRMVTKQEYNLKQRSFKF